MVRNSGARALKQPLLCLDSSAESNDLFRFPVAAP